MSIGPWWQQRATKGHASAAAVGFVGDDVYMALADGDGQLTVIYNVSSGGDWETLQRHDAIVDALAIGRVGDTDLLLSAGADGTRAWHLHDGAPHGDLNTRFPGVRAMTVHHSGVILASADGNVHRWHPISGTYWPEQHRLAAPATCLWADHTGEDDRIVAGCDDGAVAIWWNGWLGSPDLVPGPAEAGTPVTSVAVGSIERRRVLAVGGRDGSVRTHVLESGRDVGLHAEWPGGRIDLEGQFLGHISAVTSMQFTKIFGHVCIMAGAADGTVVVWDLLSRKVTSRFTAHTRSVLAVHHLQGDGGEKAPIFVTAGWDNVIREWRRRGDHNSYQHMFNTPRVRVVDVGLMDGRDVLASGGDDGRLQLWEPSGHPSKTLRGRLGSISALALISGREGLVVAGDAGGRIGVWNAAGEGVAHLRPHEREVVAIAPIVLGGRPCLFSASYDGSLVVHDLAIREELARTKHSDQIRAAHVYRHEGVPHAVTADDDRTLSVWDLRTCERVRGLGPNGSTVLAVCTVVVADRLGVIAGDASGRVQVWDLATGNHLREIEAHAASVTAVAVTSIAGQLRVASAGLDGLIRIWDPADWTEVQPSLRPHDGWGVHSFKAVDEVFVSGGADGTLAVSEVGGGAQHRRAHTALPPDEATTVDAFGSAGRIAGALAEFIRDPATRAPLTIGIEGAWGSGKSSVMKMLRDEIDPVLSSDDADVREAGSERQRRWTLRRRSSPGPGGRRRLQLVVTSDVGRTRRRLARLFRRGSGLSGGEALLGLDSKGTERARVSASPAWRPTAWFNPWQHQSEEQIWAGLAGCIIDEITGRLTQLDRERFFGRLNLARIDRTALRYSLYRAFLGRLSIAVGGLAAAAGVLVATGSPRLALGGLSVGSLAAGAGVVGTMLLAPVSRLLPALVSSPASPAAQPVGNVTTGAPPLSVPTDRRGYAFLAYVDLKRVIDLVATPDQPLVVFVDDLDRCSPSVVSQTIEAVNMFTAGPFDNCCFVLALDPSVIAAQIAAVHTPVGPEVNGQGPDHVGWLFLQKIIQLPIRLPKPSRTQAAGYIKGLLPRPPADRPAEATAPAPEARGRSATAASDDDLTGGPGGDDDDRPAAGPTSAAGIGTAYVPSARDRFGLDLATRPEYHAACEWAAHHLVPDANPRHLKRVLALCHAHSLIALRLGALQLDQMDELERQIKEIAVLSAMSVRWPKATDHLLSPLKQDPQGLPAVDHIRQQVLEMASGDSATQRGLDYLTAGLPPDLVEFLGSNRRLLGMATRLAVPG